MKLRRTRPLGRAVLPILGEGLRAVRIHANVSREDMAKIIGYHQQASVWKLEKGHMRPSQAVLDAYAALAPPKPPD